MKKNLKPNQKKSKTELPLPSSHLWERGGRRGRSPLRPMEAKSKKIPSSPPQLKLRKVKKSAKKVRFLLPPSLSLGSAKKSVSSFVSSSTQRTKSSSPFKSQNLRDFKSTKERRNYLEKKLNIKLANIGRFSLNEEIASKRNCENMIGVTQIPLGVAGPLKIKGHETKGNFFVPLATTEAALIASVNRGCKAITLAGGANTKARRAGTTRGPVFYVGSLQNKERLEKWLENNKNKIKEIAEKTDPHLKFERFESDGPANYLFLRLYFDTCDAMGMNMATIASQQIADFVEKETKIKCLAVAGNFDIDKKPAWLNFIKKRGFEVWAEIILSKKIVEIVLKTTAPKIFDVWLAKSMIGSALSGSLGFNGHFANIVAALFIATGQDPGHITEGSMGITTAKIKENNKLYFSVYLPDLMVGTVGGGTGLATQKEALDLLGIAGGDKGKNSARLAEITGAAVLAGELSLLASLAEGTLSKAHLKLARGSI